MNVQQAPAVFASHTERSAPVQLALMNAHSTKGGT